MVKKLHFFNRSLLLVGVILLLTACQFQGQNKPPRPIAQPEATAILDTQTPDPTSTSIIHELTPAPTEAMPTLAPTLEPTQPLVATVGTSGQAATETPLQALAFSPGRNDYTLQLENTPREFIVYVPSGYDPNRPTPVVLMFHGSNQSGKLMYENTGWVAKAEEENFIVVFPTSWKYRLIDSNRVEDKWNTANMKNLVVPGTELKDDVRFVQTMLDLLKLTFNVDEKRFYATGFSNGGAFVQTVLMFKMNEVFAAFATCGAGLWGNGDGSITEKVPEIQASLYAVMGSNDEKMAENTGASLPLPVRAEEMLAHPFIGTMLKQTTAMLSLDMAYTVAYEKPAYATMTFRQSLVGGNNQFIFRMVNNMGHIYPSGKNNRYDFNVSDLFWEFFQQYAKP